MTDKKGRDKGGEAPPDLMLQAAAVLNSAELFGDKNLVLIRHGKDWYRLMITRQGKLILMK